MRVPSETQREFFTFAIQHPRLMLQPQYQLTYLSV